MHVGSGSVPLRMTIWVPVGSQRDNRRILLSVDTRSTRRSTRIIFPTKIHVLLSVDTRSTPTCGASLWPCVCASSMRRSGPWWDVCCARAARQRRCASLRRQQWQRPHHSHRSARWLPACQATHSLPASWTSPRRSLSSACTLMMVTMAKYRMLSSQARANSGQHRTWKLTSHMKPLYVALRASKCRGELVLAPRHCALAVGAGSSSSGG